MSDGFFSYVCARTYVYRFARAPTRFLVKNGSTTRRLLTQVNTRRLCLRVSIHHDVLQQEQNMVNSNVND